MTSFLELRFITPSGTQVATVFTDDQGNVTSEHGLAALMEELRRRKKVKTPPTLDPALTEAFFNLNAPAPAGLEGLRESYLRDRQAAETRGCSKCTRSAIYRKYATLVNETKG